MAEQQAVLEFEPTFVPESEIIVPLRKVLEKPQPTPYVPFVPPEKKGLILNIETSGFNPLKDRIIAVGLQDPLFPDEQPTIIMLEDEAAMLNALFSIIADFGYSELIGYGLSFDFRFVVVKAMKHGIPCKQFADMSIYDLGQAMAQVKMAFVYFAQKQPALSDVADFFWSYPKPFTDLEMLKFYASGEFGKVVEFASSQVTRILLLYLLFRSITETPYSSLTSEVVSAKTSSFQTTLTGKESLLTIPEANAPETWLAKCPNDLSEWNVPVDQLAFVCPIDGTIIKKQ